MAARVLPPVEPISGGVWSLPLPMGDNPLAYVCAYVLECPDGLVLVDTGWNRPETYAALVDGLATVGSTVDEVRGVLVTHIHADHYGLAGRIQEESGAWVALHPAEAELVHDRYTEPAGLLERIARWLRSAGVPDDQVEALRDASMDIRDQVVTASDHVLLEHGDRPDVPGWDLVALHTPGHTPGHLIFRSDTAGIVFTGDHVLPRITPHVGFHPHSGDDPLGQYLRALEEVRGGGDVLVAPGHEYRFRGLDQRIDQLREHHEERLAEVERLVAEGGETVWEVAARYPWSRGWDRLHGFMLRAALAEVHAHLVALERRGRLRREGTSPERWRPAT